MKNVCAHTFRLVSDCKIYFALALLLLNSPVLFAQPNTWVQKADLPFATGRERAVAISINGMGYFGTGDDGVTFYKDWWQYDPVANAWTQKADFGFSVGGTVRNRAIALSINGKGYVGTGWNGSVPLDFWYEYDPVTNNWTKKADFGGNSRYSASCFTIGNKGYVGLGFDGGNLFGSLWEYDPVADAWTQKANFVGSARYSATGFSIGTFGYMGCGYDGSYLKDFWRYSPVTNSWKQIADLPGGVRAVPTSFAIGKRGFVVGGSNVTPPGPDAYSDLWEYNPFLDSWVQRASIPVPRCTAPSFVIGNTAYVAGGANGSVSTPVFYKDLWQYTPSLLGSDKFQKSYGGTNSDTDTSNIAFASPTPDGGYVISSTTKSSGLGGEDIYLLKVGPSGTLLWGKTFGATTNESSASVRPTVDGGFIIAGSTRKSASDEDLLVLKINSAGLLQWNRALSGTQMSRANYAEEAQAGGEYLVVGKGELAGWNNTCLFKLSGAGVPVISRNVSVTSSVDEGFSLVQTTSGNYLISGNMMSGATDVDAYLVALNNTGGIVAGAHGRFDSQGLNSTDARSIVRQTADGGFIICGSSNAPGVTHGLFDFFLLKVQNNFTISWAKIYGGPQDDFARSITITNDGNFAVAGYTKSYGFGTDAFLSLIDGNGTPLWTKTYGGSLVDKANSVYQAADGGFVLCGETFSFASPASASDIYLIKTDSLGNSGCNEASVSLSPNSLTFTLNPSTGTAQNMATNIISATQTTASTTVNPLCSQCTFPLTKGKTNVKCFGTSTGSAFVNPVGGVAPYTYLWSTSATTSAVSGLAAGTYTVAVADANLCSSVDTIKIIQPPPLVLNVANDSVNVCAGNSATLGANAIGGSPPISYLWSPATGLSCTTCQNPAVISSGTTSYVISVLDSNQCTRSDTVNVYFHSPPNANAGADKSICGNVPVSIGATPANGVNYSWSPPAGLNNSTIANPTANPAFTTTYVVTASNAPGCFKKDTVVVTVISAPTINIAATSYTLCTGISPDTLIATSFSGANYAWSPGLHPNNDTIIIGPFASPGTFTYSVSVSNGGGCSGTASVTINVSPGFATPTVVPNPANYCFGDTLQPFVFSSSVAFVGWTDLSGNPLQFGPAYTPTVTAAGSYTFLCVQGTGKYCLSIPAIVNMTIHPLPVADAGKDVTICAGHTAQLQASGGTSYLWSADSSLSVLNIPNPSADPDSTFSYQVTVTDANGCKDRDSVTVFISMSDSCGIHVFNVFTPNNDGLNEGWIIDGIDLYPENTVIIFNRWGTRVWGGKDYDNKKVVWKGNNDQGQPLPAGTYYYVINIKGINYSKWVELLR